MKKTFTVLSAISMSVFLGACTGDEEAAGNQETVTDMQEETTDNEEFTDDRAEGIKFNYFEINVEYPDMIETAYQVEYEKEDDGLEASLDDNINGEEHDGAQAFEILYPIFTEQLTFDETTDQEEIVSQLVEGFNLREDFEFMEVDIDMSNGETIEFEAENN
ncbi:YusW family protein [Bacillus sp. SCS-153A]|uniref:YusW family protein n=1 Tax=Rossellomorea sedimentorum TaxID=3115294 RepID=UPI003905F0C8